MDNWIESGLLADDFSSTSGASAGANRTRQSIALKSGRSSSTDDNEGDFRTGGRQLSASPAWFLNVKLENYVLMEVAWGSHQLVELSAGDILKIVRAHRFVAPGVGDDQVGASPGDKGGRVGDLTYRDIKQVFNNLRPIPSLEIRRHCILVCFPPVTAIIFHDRCVFHINERIDTDKLVILLEKVTGHYVKRADETEKWWLNTRERLLGHGIEGGRDKTNEPRLETVKDGLQHVSSRNRSMLFGSPAGAMPGDAGGPGGGGNGFSKPGGEEPADLYSSGSNPRFVQFPLEFALFEIVTSYAASALAADIDQLEKQTEAAIAADAKVPIETKLADFNNIRETLEAYLDRVTAMSKAFQELLTNQEDMKHMELTKLFYIPYPLNPESDLTLNPNLEVLLEYFDQELDLLQNRGVKIARSLDRGEKTLTMQLSVLRNELHMWELACTIITAGLGGGSCISGVFGMNLRSYMEDNPYAFFVFTFLIIVSVITGVSATLGVLFRYRWK